MLQNFALLNNTAFVTLFEKFEKVSKEANEFDAFSSLEVREFSSAKQIKNLRRNLEQLYSTTFLTKMDARRAREELSARRHDKRDVNMYLIGFFFGFSVPLIMLWLLSGSRKLKFCQKKKI